MIDHDSYLFFLSQTLQIINVNAQPALRSQIYAVGDQCSIPNSESRARHSIQEQNIGCGGGSPRSMIRIRRPDPCRKPSVYLRENGCTVLQLFYRGVANRYIPVSDTVGMPALWSWRYDRCRSAKNLPNFHIFFVITIIYYYYIFIFFIRAINSSGSSIINRKMWDFRIF